MKIFVTGASGFIGFHLCKKLLMNDQKVIGIDTMGIVNYKFAGFDSKYIKSKYTDKSFFEFFKKYNVKCLENNIG